MSFPPWPTKLRENLEHCQVCVSLCGIEQLKNSPRIPQIAEQCRQIGKFKTALRKIMLRRADLAEKSFNPVLDASAFVRSVMNGDERSDPNECPMCKNARDLDEIERAEKELLLEDANRQVKLLKFKPRSFPPQV